ncbi:hypothetical protein [Palaeococcus sp. (in: euryarchaeotes)]
MFSEDEFGYEIEDELGSELEEGTVCVPSSEPMHAAETTTSERRRMQRKRFIRSPSRV